MIFVNGTKVEWKEGMTIADVMKIMKYDFVYITVTVNGRFVSPEEYEDFIVADNADVKAIHLHHGG